jgi:hypothetical protein
MSFLSRWRPYHLLLAWGAYWILLLAFALGPALPAILRATQSEGKHGEINAAFGDAVLSVTVKEMGQITWSGSVHFLTAALWVALPPLVLWALWLRERGRAARPVSEPLTY